MHNIRKTHLLLKNKNMLKNLFLYSEEIKSAKKKNKDFSNIRLLYELTFFLKEYYAETYDVEVIDIQV